MRPTGDGGYERLVERIHPGSRLLRVSHLQGGVSAQVAVLDTVLPGDQVKRLIVRRYGLRDIERKPHVAATEHDLLQVLHATGLPVPRPCYLDQTGDIFPAPCLVTEFVDGEPDFEPEDVEGMIVQLATHLAAIHDVNTTNLTFVPGLDTRPDDWIRREGGQPGEHVRAAETLMTACFPQRPATRSLLHGDFWPGNVLWKGGHLVAIIDWEDAALGDPLADLANSRLEVLWAFGPGAMDAFTRHYRSRAGFDAAVLPYWDLWAALRAASRMDAWNLDQNTQERMERDLWRFVTRALEKT